MVTHAIAAVKHSVVAVKLCKLFSCPLIVLVSVFFRDEIGLIQCPEARYNRSPIVLVENKLGVESWCVKFLLPYVHNKLLLYRQRKHWLDREGIYFE